MKQFNSGEYWEKRYKDKGNSGTGSYGKLADFKAKVINPLIKDKMVLELGCGDGNQLKTFKGFKHYFGTDVSKTIVKKCQEEFKSQNNITIAHSDAYNISTWEPDVSMSLDVLYHLIEDEVYEAYMADLFGAGAETVIVYSKNFEPKGKYATHVRPRKFTDYVAKNFPQYELVQHVPQPHYSTDHLKGTDAEFYIYKLK